MAKQQFWAYLRRLRWGSGENKAALNTRAMREDGKAGAGDRFWALPSPVGTPQARDLTGPSFLFKCFEKTVSK